MAVQGGRRTGAALEVLVVEVETMIRLRLMITTIRRLSPERTSYLGQQERRLHSKDGGRDFGPEPWAERQRDILRGIGVIKHNSSNLETRDGEMVWVAQLGALEGQGQVEALLQALGMAP